MHTIYHGNSRFDDICHPGWSRNYHTSFPHTWCQCVFYVKQLEFVPPANEFSHFRYGCPNIEEIKKFNSLYKTRLDEIIESGEIPLDLAIEVRS